MNQPVPSHATIALLAQQGQQAPAEQSMTILWSLGWLVAAVLVLALSTYLVRRLMIDRGEDQPPGLTLGELRRMRDQGQLSDEEFEATRQTLIGKSQVDTPAEAGGTEGSAESGEAEGSGESGGSTDAPDGRAEQDHGNDEAADQETGPDTDCPQG
jgi:hypothetical protein